MFNLPDLPYSYSALEPFIDEATMRVHHTGHHAAYVKNLNDALAGQDELLNMDVEKLLRSLDLVPDEVRVKVKNNAGGHYHHSVFWPMLNAGGGEPAGRLLDSIKESFGDFESFKNNFTQSALGLFGSGWTWMAWQEQGIKIINTPNQDSPVTEGPYPLLGIDVWEHAYYLKYQNKRAEYVSAWWNLVNWEEVSRRLESRVKT